jgi:hypothetical protein
MYRAHGNHPAVCQYPISAARDAQLKDPSPLIRGAATDALQRMPTKEAVRALVAATGDEYRLVRVRAAASLAAYPNLSPMMLTEKASRLQTRNALPPSPHAPTSGHHTTIWVVTI